MCSTRTTHIDFWHMVNLQDWNICERVQRGMASRSFDHGRYSPMEDPSLDIRRWWTTKMNGTSYAFTGAGYA